MADVGQNAGANFPIGTVVEVRETGMRGKVIDHPLYTERQRPLRPYCVSFSRPGIGVGWFAAAELAEAK